MGYGNNATDVYAEKMQYVDPTRAGLVPSKEASVQDRIGNVLHGLTAAHAALDALEGNIGPEGPGMPPLGLLQGALACEEQTGRLCQRLAMLRDRLGNL